jgi:hypothetical protein
MGVKTRLYAGGGGAACALTECCDLSKGKHLSVSSFRELNVFSTVIIHQVGQVF